LITIAQAPAAAPVTAAGAASTTAAVTGIFNVIAGEPGAGSQLNLSAPGTNRLNGQPFRIRAAGYCSFASGTYTASIQPLLYASTAAGFTASAAAAIVSNAGIVVTVASASTIGVPWAIEAYLSGDTTSGTLAGISSQIVNNQTLIVTTGATAPVAILNIPTSISFATEPPLQFAAAVTIGATSNDFPKSNVVSNLTQFVIEG
jgi:hypothetical protein